MCSGLLCHICGPISLSSWLFLRFLICGLIQVSLVVFNFSIAVFLLLPLDQNCSQVHILTSYCFCGAHCLKITYLEDFTRLGASSP